jgi:hypothetical protein
VITSDTIRIAISFGSLLIITAIVMGGWVIGTGRKAKAAITKDTEYGRLAEDYRRLSELAVTAQEHADLKLGEIHMGLKQLRDQLADVQKILKEVE